jgi:hypothetical protein
VTGTGNQRWRDRKTSMRPSDPIDTSKYEVVAIAEDKPVKTFVERHHYSASYPAARARILLYRSGEIVGAAVFSHPASESVLARLPCERMAGVELGRFVLLDDVPGNGETWFLARCFAHLRSVGIECVLSHSDPMPRRAENGNVVMPGHVGTIYQATNAVYAGRARAQVMNLLPDGTCFSERSMSKIRSAERGWERECRVLVKHGASPSLLEAGGKQGDPRWQARRDWMWQALAQVCRRVDHAGNHRYLWALDKHLRRDVARMKSSNGYPKQTDAEAA